jgi:ribosomal protein S27AE
MSPGSGAYSRKSKGGMIASFLEHQDSAGAFLAIEAIGGLLNDVPHDLLRRQAYVACEWQQDLELRWSEGVVFVQVKDQELQPEQIRSIVDDFRQIAESHSAADTIDQFFRIEALAGLSTSARSLVADLKHLRAALKVVGKDERVQKCQQFEARWSMPASVASRLTIESRDLRRDSVAALATFAHLLRSVYPVRDYTDARIAGVWQDVVVAFARARRNRAPILLSTVDESVLRPLLPMRVAMYEHAFVRTSYGYVVDPERKADAERDAAFVRRALKKAMSDWRRQTRGSRWRNFLYRGAVNCPACNHPMMANRMGRRGIACGRCGYFPYATMVYICDCGELVPIMEQPSMNGVTMYSEAVDRLRSHTMTCGSCGASPQFELLNFRLGVLPFPVPVAKFSERDLIEKRVRLGWRGGYWSDTERTPVDRMLEDEIRN